MKYNNNLKKEKNSLHKGLQNEERKKVCLKKHSRKMRNKHYFSNAGINFENFKMLKRKMNKKRYKRTNIKNNFILNNKKKNFQKDKEPIKFEENAAIKRLNQEINDYVNMIQPQGEELEQRKEVVRNFIEIIKAKFPKWKVQLFGSFLQGTQTIHSDIDFVVFKSNEEVTLTDDAQLRRISKALSEKRFGYNIHYIHAKVPIVKGVSSNGVYIDISVNRDNGCKAAELIKRKIEEIKILKPLIVFLKQLLRENGLNDASVGGMSSFLLFSLVFFYYQRSCKEKHILAKIEQDSQHSEIETEDEEKYQNDKKNTQDKEIASEKDEPLAKMNNINYSEFLLKFLKFFGEFEYEDIGISLRNGGEIFYKVEREEMRSNKYLSVENFQEPSSDIGRSCNHFQDIQNLFRSTHKILETAVKKNYQGSFLKKIGLLN